MDEKYQGLRLDTNFHKFEIRRLFLRWLLGLFLFLCLSIVPSSRAQDNTQTSARARLSGSRQELSTSDRFLDRSTQSTFTVISSKRWNDLAKKVYSELEQSNIELEKYLGRAQVQSISIELLSETDFFQLTGAPLWTNAMYYEGRIMIPVLEPIEGENFDNIVRSVRHEYSHAYISAASGGKCPGWLDEGLAQWFEGPVNPLIQNILAKHLRSSAPVPMIYLQNGFTKLDTQIVGAAYGQSLFAALSIIKTYPFRAIQKFFAMLKDGQTQESAFKEAFGISTAAFETKIRNSLWNWVRAYDTQKQVANHINQISMYQTR